jgi:hypothetical protein
VRRRRFALAAVTILDLVGAAQPKDFFDGRSFRPVLEGKATVVSAAYR